jgi:hypothetical protein
MICTLPSCDIKPHDHIFDSGQCIKGKHEACLGYHFDKRSSLLEADDVMRQRHRIENQEIHAKGYTVKDAAYWKVAERQRADYQIRIDVREGKRREPTGLKVWTCGCKCHPSRGHMTVWSFLRQRRGLRPWQRQELPTIESTKPRTDDRLSVLSRRLQVSGPVRLATWFTIKSTNGI